MSGIDFTILENFSSVEEYANRCGIRVATVYDRFRRRQVSGLRIDGMLFIDHEASPPSAYLGRTPPLAPPPRLPAGMPPPSQLIRLSSWCWQNGITSHGFFTDILMGRRKAWGFGGCVVIERDADFMAQVAKRKAR